MRPAGLMQTLEQMKTVGLKYALTSEQAAEYANTSITQQGGSYQKL